MLTCISGICYDTCSCFLLKGRGAPEIDIFEIMGTQYNVYQYKDYIPAYISTSYQISPGLSYITLNPFFL